jgi:hypothetical protein
VLLLPVTVKVALRASLSRHSALFTIAGGVLLFRARGVGGEVARRGLERDDGVGEMALPKA